MTDKPLTIELPADLIDKATAARIDLRATIEKALTDAVTQHIPTRAELYNQEKYPPASMEEKEAIVRKLLPPDRIEEALRLLHEGKRIPGLHQGFINAPDDIMDPLPESIWGDIFP